MENKNHHPVNYTFACDPAYEGFVVSPKLLHLQMNDRMINSEKKTLP